jgi:hypothetical protein
MPLTFDFSEKDKMPAGFFPEVGNQE